MLEGSVCADRDVKAILGAVTETHLLGMNWHVDLLAIHASLSALSEVATLTAKLLLLHADSCSLSAENSLDQASTGATLYTLSRPRAPLLTESGSLGVAGNYLLPFNITLHVVLI